MEKETKRFKNSFGAKKRWLSPEVQIVSYNQSNDIITESDQRDVTVDDGVWYDPEG